MKQMYEKMIEALNECIHESNANNKNNSSSVELEKMSEILDSFQSQITEQMESDIFELYLTGLVSGYKESRNPAAIEVCDPATIDEEPRVRRYRA